MDDQPGQPRAVELRAEPDITLGRARVRPSACEVEVDGQATRIEPRVMQVLVLLAQANGGVVSRADLIDRCWGGRIVGEDAINRALLKLRKLPFEIETIPKIGYRLKVADPPASRRRRPGLVAAAGLAVALVAGFGFWAATQRPGKWEVGGVETIVGEDRAEGWPSISPDGRILAYTLNPGDEDMQSAIWVRSVTGGDPVLFAADGPSVAHAPAWSPQGDRIAFVRVFPEGADGRHEPCAIVVKPFPAGAEQTVGRCRFDRFVSRLNWSPDGAAIYFSERVAGPNGPRVVRRLDLGRRTVTSVTQPAGLSGDFNAAVSPRGDRLAFVRYPPTDAADVFVQDLRTGALRRLTHDASQAWVDWSADGRSLFVASRRGGSFELRALDPEGRRAPQRLLATPQDILRPSAGRDVIAFETRKQVMEIGWLRDGRRDVATSGRLLYPDVSSSGVLAYVEWGPSRLMVQRPGGPPQRVLDLPQTQVRGLSWAPDGRRIAFAGVEAGKAQIFVADLETATLRRLTAPPIAVVAPSWTADGRSLVFAGDDGRGSRVWRVAADGSGPPVAVSGPGWADAWAGQAGEVYAVRPNQPGVWRLASGKPPGLIAPAPAPTYGQEWNWLVRRGRIWVVTGPENERRLLSWTLDGREPKAEALPEGAEAVTIDPRTGDMVILRRIRNDADIGLLHLRRR